MAETEESLLKRAVAGDDQALVQLFELHRGTLLGIAQRSGILRGDHEDFVHDIFVRLLRNPPGVVSQSGSIRPWLVTTAKRHAIDLFRKRCKRPNLPLEFDPVWPERPTEDTILHEGERAVLESAIRTLSPMVQAVCWRRLIERKTVELIAKELETSTSAVSAACTRGIDEICTLLKVPRPKRKSGVGEP